MNRHALACIVAAGLLPAHLAQAQLSVTVTDINPDRSTHDPVDPDGASGGRVNGIAVAASQPATMYAASEWGGLFRSTDSGQRWVHVDGHVPTATWDVAVDPANANRVYATSWFDGRVASRSGINVSSDGGVTWTHPASATPPAGFCLNDTRRTELAAFGIAIDPANAARVFIGTNCGLAISVNSGGTWTFVDPTPNNGARDVWDVVVHHGGIIDMCGDDGHQRSTDGGATWTTANTTPLPAGRCSIAASPDEAYVLFASVGLSIFESNDGLNWAGTYANPSPQGRIPFVATNQRQGATYDLWFGDVSLHRGTCTTPNPAAPGGAQRCNASAGWAGGFTRLAGGHDDTADILFAPGVNVDACPVLFSSDGGVYRNTVGASPGCHTPAWEQPLVTPHALWNFSFSGSPRAGVAPEDLYFGNQDNGSFGTTNGGAAVVNWTNQECCDGFDTAGETTRGLTTICCFGGPRATLMFLSPPGLAGAPIQVNTYPAGNVRAFEHLEGIVNFGPDDYVVLTTAGVFVTLNIGASPIVWTQLGAGNSPGSPCGVRVSSSGGTATFFVKSGGCNGDAPGPVWRHQGTAAGGTWTQVVSPGPGGFGVYSVNRHNPQRIIGSHLGGPGGPRMVLTSNGGATWNQLTALDTLMTGGGTFLYTTLSGPNRFTSFAGYPQPSLVAFDPLDPDIIVAGGQDSGVFVSVNGGTRWQLVTDPVTPGASGVAHIPRPYYAHFDHDSPAGDINVYLGTRGRGAWRLTFKKVPSAEVQVPSAPTFLPSCVGDTRPGVLQVCNTSLGNLVVTGITSTDAQFSVVPASGGFPVTISHDFCFPFQVLFTPTSPGPKSTTLSIASNDPNFPSLPVAVSTSTGAAVAVSMIADSGGFGQMCQSPGQFKDLPLTINNGGTCPLTITGISSSLPAFETPQVVALPTVVGPGNNIALPIRFVGGGAGAHNASITIATNDPASPNTVVGVSATVPPVYVCEPPLFTAVDGAVGPTFGSAATGGYTVNTTGHFLGSFGAGRRFALQAQGEYRYYPGRQEGQMGAALLYRRNVLQVGVGASVRNANLRGHAFPGTISEATLGIDALLPTVRFGLFGSKGLQETDVVDLAEIVGAPLPGGGPIVATERVIHTVDSLGGQVQFPILPLTWIDANVALLYRHAPGASNTAGAAVRISRQFLPWLAGFAAVDVNESFVGATAVGTVTFGVRVGLWPQPQDYSNPVNPLGTLVPRVRYEIFDRVR